MSTQTLARIALGAGLLVAAAWPQVIDRTAAIVGQEAITASEIDRQIRLEALFGERPLAVDEEIRQQALERLIDQRLITREIAVSGLTPISGQEVQRAFEELRRSRFRGMDFEQALEAYGVSEEAALEFFRRQIEFTSYVEFRFRTGQPVPEEELAARYRQIYGRQPAPGAPTLEEVREELRNQILSGQAEQALEGRIRELRAESRIVILPPIPRDEETGQEAAIR